MNHLFIRLYTAFWINRRSFIYWTYYGGSDNWLYINFPAEKTKTIFQVKSVVYHDNL